MGRAPGHRNGFEVALICFVLRLDLEAAVKQRGQHAHVGWWATAATFLLGWFCQETAG